MLRCAPQESDPALERRQRRAVHYSPSNFALQPQASFRQSMVEARAAQFNYRAALRRESEIGRSCCKSRRQRIGSLGLSLRAAALTRWPGRCLRNSDATRYTEPGRVADERLAMRAVASSERWQPEQTHAGRLVGHAVEVDRASRCASSVRTASRSSCAPVATAQSPRCKRTTGQRHGRVHGCRAGSCVMVLLGSTRANIAVELTGTIQKCSALVHCTARPEPLSARAVVDVACRTISKVAARAERCTTMRAKDVLTETAQGVSLTREATSLPATSLQPATWQALSCRLRRSISLS